MFLQVSPNALKEQSMFLPALVPVLLNRVVHLGAPTSAPGHCSTSLRVFGWAWSLGFCEGHTQDLYLFVPGYMLSHPTLWKYMLIIRMSLQWLRRFCSFHLWKLPATISVKQLNQKIFRSFNFSWAYMSEIGWLGFLFFSSNFPKSVSCYLFPLSLHFIACSSMHGLPLLQAAQEEKDA